MNIDEIARLAGVSNAAVSRYFNNGYVSKEKKEAIRAVVEKTGYRPSAQARTLRMGRTMAVQVITTRIAVEPFSATLAGILSVLEEQGYHIVLHVTGSDTGHLTRILDTVDAKNADGLILINHLFTSENRKQMKQCGIPCVIVGEQAEGFSSVFHDDRQMVYETTRRIILDGRKNLFYIGVRKQELPVSTERLKGFEDAVHDSILHLEKEGEELPDEGSLPEIVVHTGESSFSVDSGYAVLKEMVLEYGMPDGIVCAADVVAAGAVKLLYQLGRSVPDETIVSGIGDTQIASASSILTVRCYFEQRGEIAARMLLDHMNDPSAPIRAQRLGYSFINYGAGAARRTVPAPYEKNSTES